MVTIKLTFTCLLYGTEANLLCEVTPLCLAPQISALFGTDRKKLCLLTALDAAKAEIELGPVARTGGMNRGSTEGTSIYTRDPDNNLIEFIIYG